MTSLENHNFMISAFKKREKKECDFHQKRFKGRGRRGRQDAQLKATPTEDQAHIS